MVREWLFSFWMYITIHIYVFVSYSWSTKEIYSFATTYFRNDKIPRHNTIEVI